MDIGEPQENYFTALNQELKNYKRAIPCLIVDLDRLDKNIEALKNSIKEAGDFRIVVKSLPSKDMIQYIMEKANTSKLMVFHQPFLSDLSSWCKEDVDILLGKPMPVKTAHYFYDRFKKPDHEFNPFTQIQWLIDTEQRLLEYLELAKKLRKKLRINLEIDIGLHRGGFSTLESLTGGVKLMEENKDWLTFSGFMGYDPHVVKLPGIIRSQAKAFQMANNFYHQCKALLQENFSDLYRENLTFNGAGSPTIELHAKRTSPLNDISAGSALVKPTSFDIPTLKDFQPACFIATPILKKFEGTTLPAMEKMKSFLNLMNSNNKQSYFIYGGFWKADYCYPVGVQQNALFGASTNQTMLNAPNNTILEVDDFVFLRPHQSEFVLLQFGNILTIRKGKIVGEWRLLNNN